MTIIGMFILHLVDQKLLYQFKLIKHFKFKANNYLHTHKINVNKNGVFVDKKVK